MPDLSYFERFTRWISREHFRIPEAAYWCGLLGGVLSAFFLPLPAALVPVWAAALSLVGILRWRHYRRGVVFLVLPRPATVESNDPIASRAQELILESLSGRLTPQEMSLVRTIPARVGPTDVRFADAIRRRLRGVMILVGRVDGNPQGTWSLFSGVVSAPEEEVVHLDWHTRDRTPTRTTWGLIVDYLSPTRDVEATQDPILATAELEAIVRALAGRLAALVGDTERAERELRAAIAASGDSLVGQIDELRCALADVLVDDDRRPEAIALLRNRARQPDPSPELLRRLARYLGDQPGDFVEYLPRLRRPAEHQEAIEALRRAAEVRSDPKRAMTLYNLSASLGDKPEERTEALECLREAMAASRYYRDAWYTHRSLGASHYGRALQMVEQGRIEEARAAFSDAADEYLIAIRKRPRVRFLWTSGDTRYLVHRFPASAILHANAADALAGARRTVRARWHQWRTARLRSRCIKRGNRFLAQGLWEAAYAKFDFAVVGLSDFPDAYAHVMRSVSLQQMGHPDEAAADFGQADARFPDLALVLRLGCTGPGAPTLPAGIPGAAPATEEGVFAELRRRGFMP